MWPILVALLATAFLSVVVASELTVASTYVNLSLLCSVSHIIKVSLLVALLATYTAFLSVVVASCAALASHTSSSRCFTRWFLGGQGGKGVEVYKYDKYLT